MFNRDFVKDDNVIRHCQTNISKMNIFELMFLEAFIWKLLGGDIAFLYKEAFKAIWQGMIGIFTFVISTLFLATFPISYPIACWMKIRDAKKLIIEKAKRRNKNSA